MPLPRRCIDVTPSQIAEALHTKEATGELLAHMAKIAKPGEGAAKILVVIARLATTECDWLEGGLVVTLVGAERTQLTIAVDLGVGMRELLFPRLTLGVPRAEIASAIRKAPALVFPMMAFFERDKVVLTCDAEAVGTLPPPSFLISEASLRKSLAPAVRKSLLPPKDAAMASLPPLYSDLASLKVDVPAFGEADLLAAIPKRARVPDIGELDDVDAAWEAAGTAEAEPEPAKPTRRPPRASKAPTRGASKAPTRGSKAPPPASPPRPKRPVIVKKKSG